LTAGDVAVAEKLTAIPFTFLTTKRRKKCEGVAKASALRARLKCIRQEEQLLISDLADGGLTDVRQAKETSAPLDPLSKKVSTPGSVGISEW
jgi:hypothetical protein